MTTSSGPGADPQADLDRDDAEQMAVYLAALLERRDAARRKMLDLRRELKLATSSWKSSCLIYDEECRHQARTVRKRQQHRGEEGS